MTESRVKLLKAILLLIAITAIGTLGLMHLEELSPFDALWLTIISLSTTGYGDIVPHTYGGRVFLLVILVSGLVIVTYSLGTIVNILVEKQLFDMKGNSKMTKAIEALRNHVIVCGAGRVGGNVADALKAQEVAYVVIESNKELAELMRKDGHLVLEGDATRDDMLHQAGILRAKGIICGLSNDAYNVFVVLTARALNPGLRIVSRAVQPESVAKLRHAGADKIISPDQIGGQRMAMAMLKPTAIELIDTMFAPHRLEIQLEELLIGAESSMVGQRVRDFFGAAGGDVILVAIIRPEGAKMHPGGDEVILAGDILVLIGSRSDLKKVEMACLA